MIAARRASRVVPLLLGATSAYGQETADRATSPLADSPLLAGTHTFVSSELGVLSNAYLIETRDGIVAVDAPLTVSDASAFRARLDALGPPLLAVLITHGHPDHYNGLTRLVAGKSVPIIATAGVDRVIREWDARKEAQWKPTFRDEWPARRTFPNRTIQDGQTVSFGGVRFTAHDLGPGESHHDAYWVADDGGTRVAFVGDVVFSGEHAYVNDGHTGDWLENLATVRSALAGVDRIYPGHGPAGGPELFDRQKRYLERYREAVRTIAGGRPSLTDREKEELTGIMRSFLPEGKLAFLVSYGADSVATELHAEEERERKVGS